MIKFTTLYSILNGDLIPWLNHHDDFTNEMEPYYLTATASVPANDVELHHQIASLLQPFPALAEYLKSQEPITATTLIHPFFAIRLSQHTNTFTAFYYLTFRQETLRLFNLIINSCGEMDNEMKSFLINEYLKQLKYLALNLTDKMKDKGYSNPPAGQVDPVHYALFVARYFIVHLFFEIQELFVDIVKSPIIPKAFFQTFLKETYDESYLHPGRAYYEHKLLLWLDNDLFSYKTIRKIFEELKAEDNLELKEELVAKYENALYLHILGHNPSEIKNLLNATLVSELFASVKAEIQNQINSVHLGVDRLDIVNNELNKLFFTDSTLKNHQSVPSLLYHWLTSQATVYSTAASNIFAAVADKQVITQPKTIINKVQVQEQHKIAFQHLSFMKGVNAQNERIMSNEQFSLLIVYVNLVIEKDLVPSIGNPLPQIGLPATYIRYTFYLLHKALYGTKSIRESWINFLHDMFSQFHNAERSTTKAKFSEKPAMYDTDFQSFKK